MAGRVSSWAKDLQLRILDLAFPPQCVSCKRSLPHGLERMWCADCLGEIQSNLERCCPRCGAERPEHRFHDGRCSLCRKKRFRFRRAVAIGNYRGRLRDLVVDLKANFDDALVIQLGRLLADVVEQRFGPEAFDAIVPVPAFWWKRLSRRFQIPTELAAVVQHQLGYPIFENCIQCVRRTAKQGTLDEQGRFDNVRGAFRVRSHRTTSVAGLRLLLIDDVITSGATADQVASVLKQAGAIDVCAAGIARGARMT